MKKKVPILWLIKRIKRRIPALLLMIAATVGQALLGVSFALTTKQVIDRAVAGDLNGFTQAAGRLALIAVAILICIGIFRAVKEWLSMDLELLWKKQLLRQILHGEYAAVSKYHSGELLDRVNADVQAVNDGILTILPNISGMLVRLVASVAILATLDLKFTGILLAVGIAIILVTGLLRKYLKSLHKTVRTHDGKAVGFFQEAIENLFVVQAMGVSGEVEKRADTLLNKRYAAQKKRRNVSLAANMGVSVFSYGAALFALVWCAFRVLQGGMTLGSLTAVTQLVSQLRTPFVGLSGVFSKYVAMLASTERLMELDHLGTSEEPTKTDTETLYREMTAITAEDLSFSYDREPVLQNVSFTLPKGRFAVITGPSGVGKSTLFQLLLGIFPPQGGELFALANGERIPLCRATRGLFAYVPQGNLLFSGTLRENLLLTKPQATETELQQAIAASCLDEVIDQLPEGLETQLGENAYGLSEGQAQRLSIARAVLSDAPILLLDEATSALDLDTEAEVLRRLAALDARTCIAVTHRPAALSLAEWELHIDADGNCCTKEQGEQYDDHD